MIKISIIYNSADTAETINRAIDNSMGTTTTSQGAASNGLIIKEDLKPIIQNVQTYLNPFVDKTIFGTPPLTFHSIQAVIDWSIWGNSDTGVYVGELSDNLFDPDLIRYQMGKAPDNKISPYSGGAMFYISATPNTDYTIKIYTSDSIFVRLYLSNNPIVQDATISYNVISESETISSPEVTISNTEYQYLWIQVSGIWYTEHGGTSIMLCAGSTPIPYEPYGINIPIKFNGNTYNTYISDYLRKSDGETPVYDVMMSDGTIIRAVNSDGTEKETPTTETYTPPTLTAIWGYNTFDVDTTVSPANVTINYQDN